MGGFSSVDYAYYQNKIVEICISAGNGQVSYLLGVLTFCDGDIAELLMSDGRKILCNMAKMHTVAELAVLDQVRDANKIIDDEESPEEAKQKAHRAIKVFSKLIKLRNNLPYKDGGIEALKEEIKRLNKELRNACSDCAYR